MKSVLRRQRLVFGGVVVSTLLIASIYVPKVYGCTLGCDTLSEWASCLYPHNYYMASFATAYQYDKRTVQAGGFNTPKTGSRDQYTSGAVYCCSAGQKGEVMYLVGPVVQSLTNMSGYVYCSQGG